MRVRHQAGLAAMIAVVLGAAACGNTDTSQAMDEGLRQDLAAARAPQTSSLSISPLELGERAAPRVAKRAPQSVRRPVAAQQRAPEAATAQAPQPEPLLPAQPRQQQEQPQASPAATQRPAPTRNADESRHGPYKTEAEIFRQMPWIRP